MSDEIHAYNIKEYEKQTFAPILKQAKSLHQDVTTLFKATVDIENDVTDIAVKGDYDLVLVGLGKSIFEGSLLGKVLGLLHESLILIDCWINLLGKKDCSPIRHLTIEPV